MRRLCCAYACTHGHDSAPCCSVSARVDPRFTVEMYGWSKTITRCPCTPPSTLESCGEKISAEACSGNGLLKKMMMNNMMTLACEQILACQTGGR